MLRLSSEILGSERCKPSGGSKSGPESGLSGLPTAKDHLKSHLSSVWTAGMHALDTLTAHRFAVRMPCDRQGRSKRKIPKRTLLFLWLQHNPHFCPFTRSDCYEGLVLWLEISRTSGYDRKRRVLADPAELLASEMTVLLAELRAESLELQRRLARENQEL